MVYTDIYHIPFGVCLDIQFIISRLATAGVNCSIVGGYAVALHGAVRGTVDLDLIINHTEEQFQACEDCLKQLGFQPRLPVKASEVFKFRKEYIQRRNLIAWSFYVPNDPFKVVDIIITHDLRNLKSIRLKAGGSTVPVVSLTDLIAMKKMSGRPQDLQDVAALTRIQNAQKK